MDIKTVRSDKIYRDLISREDKRAYFRENVLKPFNKTMSCSLNLFLYIAEQFVTDNRFQNYFIKFGYNELPTFIYKAVQYYCREKSTD